MSKYLFTENWFRHAPDFMQEVLPTLPDRKSFLEIGSYEGRSTVWFVENALVNDGTIYCIDTWSGSEEHDPNTMYSVETVFDSNIKLAMVHNKGKRVVKNKGLSRETLAKYMQMYKNPWLDFVYIDGSHQAADVLTDAIMAFWQVKIGGVILFDDYEWREVEGSLHQPGIAIDAFLQLFEDKIELLLKNYQVAIRRLK